MVKPNLAAWTLSAAIALLGVGGAYGQNYPYKPIRIVTTDVGASNDFLARLIGQGIAGPLGQPLIVENRGSGLIAAETVARATPDGYTLLFYASNLWLGTLWRTLSYDAVRDFAPISAVTSSPNTLVVHPSVPANSVRELISLAKARPGELNYASGNTGAANHLAAELFKSMAGVNIVRIAYKGGGSAIIDLAAGQVHLMFAPRGPVMSYVKVGKLKALAVTSAKPSELAPGLPTVAASGLPGYELVSYDGMFAPAKTPAIIINRLNEEVVRFINRANVKETLLNSGLEAVGNSPEAFAATIRSDLAMWRAKFKEAGIRPED